MTPPSHLKPVPDGRLETHEAVCAERYEGIYRRLGTLERTLGKLLWTTGTGFAAVVVTMLGYILSRIP